MRIHVSLYPYNEDYILYKEYMLSKVVDPLEPYQDGIFVQRAFFSGLAKSDWLTGTFSSRTARFAPVNASSCSHCHDP